MATEKQPEITPDKPEPSKPAEAKTEGRIKVKYNGVIKTINAAELPTWKKNGWETV